jgi:hypothetical protein
MLTNKLNLPEPFVRAANNERYSKGESRYSVTELIKPARMAALERYYGDAIVEDVADHVWSLFGRITHGILEASGAPETGAILEERLYAEVMGVRISGQMDHTVLYPDGLLDDYKTSSVWSVMHGLKLEWEQQLNLYRWLQHVNGRAVTRLRVVVFLKDWSIAKARQDGPQGKYPKQAVVAIDVPVWELEQAETFVHQRLQEHTAADEWAQGKPVAGEPRCTDAERWVRPRKYAVIKKGNVRAIPGGLCDTMQEAEYKSHELPGSRIEARGGEPIRCIDYCSIGRAGLCTQWEEDKKNFDIEKVDTATAFD